jgi:HEAT repeat protein
MKKRITMSVVVLIAAGCASPPQNNGAPDARVGNTEMPQPARKVNMIKAPTPPPAAPAKRAVAIDPSLRNSARTQLMTDAQSDDAVLRANALEAMQDTLGEQAAPQITTALGDKASLVRFAACMAAGKLKLSSAYATLAQLANDPDDNVKVGARFALHRLGDKRRTNELEALAQHIDPGVRGNVAMAIGLLEEPSGINVLRGLAADKDMTVRLQAFEAMWRLGNRQGLESLVAGTLSSFADDQLVCVLALAQPRDSRVRPHLYGKLTSEYPEVALGAARALGMVGSDEGYIVAIKGARSPDARQKVLGALALGAIGRADAQEYLAPLLKDPSAQVRLATATAILQLKS